MNDPKVVLVSGGDANYFDMMHELGQSIRRLPESENVDVVFLDGGGFTEEHLKAFDKLNIKMLDPGFPNEKIKKRVGKRTHLKISLAKSTLNQYFPEYDVIVWVDGDAWLQNWTCIDLAVQVAQKNKLAGVLQNSRFQRRLFQFRKRLFGWIQPRTILYKNATRSRFPSKYLWQIANKSVFNGGFYALRQDAPHWDSWLKWRDMAIEKGRIFTSDQFGLACAVWIDGHTYEALPEYCNYMGPWRMGENKKYTEIFAPYNEVSLVHMAGLDDYRMDAKKYPPMVMPDDSIQPQPIRYCEWIKTQK